jgi:hypothetical protein
MLLISLEHIHLHTIIERVTKRLVYINSHFDYKSITRIYRSALRDRII